MSRKQTPKDKQVLQRLGHNIRLLRLSQGMTQEKLAELCDKSKDRVVRWENGENMPNPGSLLALTEVLHTNWGTLFHGVGNVKGDRGE